MDSDPEFGEELNLNDFDSMNKEGDVGFDRWNSWASWHSKGGATMKSVESEADYEQ